MGSMHTCVCHGAPPTPHIPTGLFQLKNSLYGHFRIISSTKLVIRSQGCQTGTSFPLQIVSKINIVQITYHGRTSNTNARLEDQLVVMESNKC